MITNNM